MGRRVDVNNRIGETNTTSFGLTVRIASYEDAKNMTVEFVDVGVTKENVTYSNFRRGKIKCPMVFKTEGSVTECVNPNLDFHFTIDSEDVPKVDGVLWSPNKGYAYNDKWGKLHKIIMPSSGQKEDIDHINGIKTDNRKENLRICTREQNNMNKHSNKRNTSGYKGVSWCKRDNKWVANIFYNGKHIFLGRFNNIFDAARAYNAKAKELFGEFASLNQIEDNL
jgi:hypothetical protein